MRFDHFRDIKGLSGAMPNADDFMVSGMKNEYGGAVSYRLSPRLNSSILAEIGAREQS